MRVLAIDTSTQNASIALYREGRGVVFEWTWRSHNHHTVELAPHLALLLKQQNLQPQGLAGLVVALGPGSFTGLRVGLSLAKGLSLAGGSSLVGIPTLDALAYSQRYQPLPLCAFLEAGRGRVCAAFYKKEGEGFHRSTDYLLTTLEELISGLSSPTLFCGEIDEVGGHTLGERSRGLATFASPASSLRRAGYLAEMGLRRLRLGETDDPQSLEPLYLSRPQLP